VNLYLEAGATLLASTNLQDYTPVSAGGSGAPPSRHLILARDAENIGLTGPGRIDGRGVAFWKPVAPAPAPEDPAREVEAHRWKQLDRPSPLLEFVHCRNVRIGDTRIDNAPGWTLRTINCDTVFIKGLSMQAPMVSAGIVITGCNDVVISDCILSTGDDTICLKSENPYGGSALPIRNVSISNCVLKSYYDGFKIGSATRGRIENISFTNSVLDGIGPEFRQQMLSGIALEMVDGGSAERITISNIRIGHVRSPIFIRLGNRTPGGNGKPGTLQDISIMGVDASGAMLPCVIAGLEQHPVTDVTLSQIRVRSGERGDSEWIGTTVAEVEAEYPETLMFGRLPAYGLYCRHARSVRLRDVSFEAVTGESRPALFCDDLEHLDVSGLRVDARSPFPRGVIHMHQTIGATVTGCLSPPGVRVFMEVRGPASRHIKMASNELSGALTSVSFGDGATA
jgi:hypothetical protein